MTRTEQAFKAYDDALMSLVLCAARNNADEAQLSKEKKLDKARKALADHLDTLVPAHSHGQYELRTQGLP